MSRRLFASLIALLVALALPASVLAQEYRFSVDKEVVDVTWNSEGTEAIEYTFTFTPQPGSHAIDFVDVGMPNSNFDMSTASADVNGTPVSVSQSDYQGSGSGFAVVLGSAAIQPGQTGSVHVLMGRVSNVLYEDSSDKNYASADFAPTFFGSQFVTGSTDLTVTFHLPPGVKPNEPRYHNVNNWPGAAQPQTALDSQGRVTYTWNAPNASASQQYTFGASFPKSYVPSGAIVTTPPFDFGALISSVMGFIGNVACCGFIALIFVGIPVLSAVQGQRRKLQYIPPRIGIEGHGIKRGLTAVEAAVLMEEPLDKVMTMTLFGVIKKGAAQVVTRDPLKIQVTDPQPEGLHDYEIAFLNAMKLDDPRQRQTGLQNMMIALIKSVGEKMKGFSGKETKDYYKSIMEQAWQQVETAQTPDVKGQKFDENLEWTMLDRNYDDRSRRVFTGPIFVPMWWGHYDPTYRPISTGGFGQPATPTAASVPSAGRGSSALPGADLAASVVGGVQSFSGNVLGGLNAFTSRVTNATNPPPPPSASTYRGGGGGHSCACACACAGCACACAGGGR